MLCCYHHHPRPELPQTEPPYSLLWSELCPPPPPNSYVEDLDPCSSEWDCIWRQGLQRGDLIKMRPFWWVLTPSDCCPYRWRSLGHRDIQGMRTGERLHEDRARRRPSAGQGERPWKKPALPILSLGFQPPDMGEHKCLWCFVLAAGVD